MGLVELSWCTHGQVCMMHHKLHARLHKIIVVHLNQPWQRENSQIWLKYGCSWGRHIKGDEFRCPFFKYVQCVTYPGKMRRKQHERFGHTYGKALRTNSAELYLLFYKDIWPEATGMFFYLRVRRLAGSPLKYSDSLNIKIKLSFLWSTCVEDQDCKEWGLGIKKS